MLAADGSTPAIGTTTLETVLLTTTLGWGDSHVRNYGGTVVRRIGRELVGGLRALKNRPGSTAKFRGLGGSLRRASMVAAGTITGTAAAIRATSDLRRRGLQR